jgi:hypothetical protein
MLFDASCGVLHIGGVGANSVSDRFGSKVTVLITFVSDAWNGASHGKLPDKEKPGP